jgi:hypothetical protein
MVCTLADKKDIRNAAGLHIALNLLLATFEISFPHFHSNACYRAVNDGGNLGPGKVIRKRTTISTGYPQ